jgi:hypothetical protein
MSSSGPGAPSLRRPPLAPSPGPFWARPGSICPISLRTPSLAVPGNAALRRELPATTRAQPAARRGTQLAQPAPLGLRLRLQRPGLRRHDTDRPPAGRGAADPDRPSRICSEPQHDSDRQQRSGAASSSPGPPPRSPARSRRPGPSKSDPSPSMTRTGRRPARRVPARCCRRHHGARARRTLAAAACGAASFARRACEPSRGRRRRADGAVQAGHCAATQWRR